MPRVGCVLLKSRCADPVPAPAPAPAPASAAAACFGEEPPLLRWDLPFASDSSGHPCRSFPTLHAGSPSPSPPASGEARVGFLSAARILLALSAEASPSTVSTACVLCVASHALRCLVRRLRSLLSHAARHWHVGLGSDMRSCSSRWLRVTQ